MPRLLSAMMILAVATFCLPNESARAQESKQECPECQQCKKCQDCPAAQTASNRTFGFELPGVDFPIGFRVVVANDANIIDKSSADAGVEIPCECKKYTDVPFLSNLPYVNKLFKNVGVPTHCACGALQKLQYNHASATANSGSNDGHDTAKTVKSTGPQSAQQHPHGVQLVGHWSNVEGHNASQPSTNRDEMFELRLRNERLQMEIEAAEQRFEMMEAVMELREENAVLRTRIEFFEAHHGNAPH